MKVIGERVLVKVKKSDECVQKVGGLCIPVGPGSGEYEIAEVLGVGEKVESINVGDTIYLYFSSGKKFHHEGEEFRVITLNEVIAII